MNNFRLLSYDKRKNKTIGQSHHSGLLPCIDMIHYILKLWHSGDIKKVDNYVKKNALRENTLFWTIG